MPQEEGAERASGNVLLRIREDKEEERYIEVEIARVLAVPREKRHDVLVGRTRGERLCLGVREGREKAQNSAQRKAWEPFESLLSFRVSGRLRSRAWI